jgi:tetratricopeptide (TPR) repeat protein
MKSLCSLSTAVLLLATGVFAAEPIADPAVALERAVQIEETTENAAEAEALYRQIIEDHERRASAAAEAKYRLGAMLIKQGKEEEGRNILLLLGHGPHQDITEWQVKAMELLGWQPGGVSPYSMVPGFGFGDPFAQPGGLDDPFGSRMGMGVMMGGALDPAMGAPSGFGIGMEAMLASRTPIVVQQAQALLNAQRYEEAAKAFEAVTRDHPTNVEAWIGLGRARLNQEQLHAAEAAYTEALSLAPNNAEALSGLGTIHKGYGASDTAMEFWSRAVESDPRNAKAWQGIATLARDRGETDEAIRALNQILQHDSQNVEARTMLQQISPDAEPAPVWRTEVELAAASELAMNEGRFEDALTLEERRLQMRIDALNPWVDKLSFYGLAKGWADMHTPSDDRINDAITAVDGRLKLLAKDDPREWRFWLVMSELAEAKGDSESATKWAYNAMHQYPQRTYVDPAKHSFYQHLLNHVAKYSWIKNGRDIAVQEAITCLENDKRLQALEVEWWLERIVQDGGDADFQRRFLERVIQAYDKRAEKFPAQAGIAAAEKQILRRRIELLSQ